MLNDLNIEEQQVVVEEKVLGVVAYQHFEYEAIISESNERWYFLELINRKSGERVLVNMRSKSNLPISIRDSSLIFNPNCVEKFVITEESVCFSCLKNECFFRTE